jgi:hypothetical protein
MKDAERIADLLRGGLIIGSLIQEWKERELCGQVKYRPSLIHQLVQVTKRIQKC